MDLPDSLPAGTLHTVLTALFLLSVIGAATPASAHGGELEQGTTITLESDGDAKMNVTLTYDLTTDSERQAFEAIEQNETTQENVKNNFKNRLTALASKANNQTERKISVSNVSIDTARSSDDDVGGVVLTAEWTNLAKKDGNQLIVSTPFDGYTTTGVFRVVPPEGYDYATATPEPYFVTGQTALYGKNTTLQNFSVTFENPNATTEEPVTENSDSNSNSGSESSNTGGQPGFGALTAFVAVAAALFAARRNQR